MRSAAVCSSPNPTGQNTAPAVPPEFTGGRKQKVNGKGGLTADRERNRLRAGAGVPIVKDNAVAVLTATALPAYQAGRLFSLRKFLLCDVVPVA